MDSMSCYLKAPFPYFGGKSKVANKVWHVLGNPIHYIEPFFGSGAVLLKRPGWKDGVRFTESINDKDGFVCNLWRSLQFNPDEVAKWCDWPVNHIDLMARKLELIKNEDRLVKNLTENPEWHDAKLAGYWVWAASCWIGSRLTHSDKRPHIIDSGKGIHALGQRPHISRIGSGVNSIRNNIYEWMDTLSKRLRYVRVVCGDWTRVCSGDWQDDMGNVGMFFDPPYGVQDRDKKLYHHDSTEVAKDVMAWCKERGKRKTYKIVLAGYEEYNELLSEGWTSESWSASNGYANSDNQNRHRETLYYSPYCNITRQRKLFI